jgi:mono/diheme cytochrome c family protein
MPAWAADYGGPLRPDQVEALTAFILNWRIAPAVAAVSTSGSGAAAAQGKALFGARDCIGCHGWPGRGGITGPDLAGVAARGATELAGFDAVAYLRASILAPSAHVVAECPTGPCPDMMPRDYGAQLSPREIELAVQYLLTLTEVAPPVPVGAPPPLVGGLATPGPVNATPASPSARGQALYTAHCAACHGEQGQGGLGSQLAPGQASVDRLRYVRAALAQGTPGMMPAWDQAHGGPLSEIDLNDLADFVVNRLGQP